MDDWLIVIRAAHFAATALTAGVLAFLVMVAQPALRGAATLEAACAVRCRQLAWIGLAATLLSGLAWVAVEIMAMTERSLGEAMHDGLVSIVLTRTTFGLVADLRLALALLLAAALAFASATAASRTIALAGAAALLASLAWSGHAAGTVGLAGPLHLAADALHLLAAGAWIGGLVPLALVLASARHDGEWAAFAAKIVRRFSLMGIVSVATLVATGAVNAWFLVGSWRALTGTGYGRLLLVKLGLFAALLALAAVNRLHLTPRLASPAPAQARALHLLVRSCMMEIALGALVFAVVGALGTLHPAIHLVPP